MTDTARAVHVRWTTAADAGDLAALQRQIYREERWFVGDGAPSEQALSRRLRSVDRKMSLWLVATDGHELQGWLELHRLPPSRLRHVATLTLAVARAYRRQGAGRALLTRGFEWALTVGVRKVSLNVRAGNEAAIRLYESEGFVLEGTERDQVRTTDGFEDSLIMARFLGE